MIIAMLGTLKAGCAYIPLPPDYPDKRLRYMISHSELSLILADCDHMELAEKLAAGTGADVCNIEEAGLAGDEYPGAGYADDRLMYILYTSGSTGNPKGVRQTCGNVLHFIDGYTRDLSITGQDRLTLLSSFSHDAAVMDIYGALLNGVTLFPLDIKEQPDFSRICQWLDREGITIWHSVPTVYRYFVNSLPGGEHLPRLRLIVLGGEAVRSHDVEIFKQRFSHARLYNLYGQTESSYNSGKFFTKQTPADTITIGETVEGTKIFLIDEDGTPVNTLETGEIVIASPYVSPGYWQDKEATGDSFRNHPKLGSLYRTGDLGRLLLDGSIEFAGRKDNQIKIRGFRVEPGEIENQLLKHEKVREAVVTAGETPARGDIEGDGTCDTYLCGYIVGKGVGEAELKSHLSSLLPGYMVPAYFVLLDRLPVTASGKVDRRALPAPDLGTGSQYVPPRNSIERQLQEIWSGVLGESSAAIGIEDNFFSLGGHSLKAITLVSRIYERLKVKISLTQLLKSPTIKGTAGYIQSSTKKEMEYAAAVPDKENLHQPFPLTDIQMTYLLGRSGHFEMGGVSTHGYKEFTAKLDLQRLNKSLNKVIRRHPMLRAIIREDGQQRILEGDLEYRIQVEDLGRLDVNEQEKRIAKEREQKSHYVFKTDEWPLFDIKAFKLAEDTYRLCIGEDRIIMDNFSSRVVTSEIMMFYLRPELDLPELEFTFRDYMMAYRGLENSEIYAVAGDYWLSRLDDFPSAPALPFKCNPSDIKKPHFKRFIEEFSRREWENLKENAGKYHITPSVLLCTAYADVLSYWSNQLRFALNLTLFNRYPFHADVNRLVGDFTSVILLAVDWKPGGTFLEKARQLRDSLFEAIEHRHYDGVRFIREISRSRHLGNKAVMPIVFTGLLFDNTDNREEQSKESPGAQEDISSIGSDESQDSYFSSQTSQAFIDNVVSDANGNLMVSWNFVEDLFDEKIISTMFEQYVTRLRNLAKGNTLDVSRLPEQDKQLWEEYNRTTEVFPVLTLHQLFSRQVKTTPHHTALVHRDSIITYKELDERSNRVAWYLREQGIGPGDFIGLPGHRAIDTIINVFGILKTGAAYVPLDPEYPRERIDYIINNSQCKLLLDPELYRSKRIAGYSLAEIEDRNSPDDIAYVIYTSGSTGKPKGVVITHRAVTNTLIDINRKFSVTGNERVIAVSSLCFDLSVYDIFGTLGSGAACIIIEDQRDIEHLLDILEKQQITFWNSVPSIMELVVNRAGAQEERDRQVCGEDGEDIYYWSPVETWQKKENSIQIGLHSYKGAALEVFPELVSITKKGISIKRLLEEFPGINLKQFNDLVEELIQRRVLVNSILSPREIFNPGNKLFLFKPGVKENGASNEKFLPGGPGGAVFSKSAPPGQKVSFKIFSDLLSLFRQTRDQDEVRYYFASAGGLYPIDIYIYIKKQRVESMEEGLYYYNPVENVLQPLHQADEGLVIPGEVYSAGNREIFEMSAISIYMIYNADVTMPKYGGLGYFMASIDAGIMMGTLRLWSEQLGIDVLPVGQIDFQRIRPYFHLEKNQVYIQSLELGLKTGKTGADDISSRENTVLKIETNGFIEKAHESGPVSPAVITPGEIFADQNQLFENKYSKAILVIPEEYEKFKKHRLSRVYGVGSGEKILLPANGELPSFIKDRRSYRDFDETRPISLETLSRLLGVSREVGVGDGLDYYYQTAAGSYKIDIFVYIKKNRVESLEAGLYYYNVDNHSLHPVSRSIIPETAHFQGNRSIFRSSAFSIFMVYDGGVSGGENVSPGALGYFKAGIHCGTAVAALTKESELSGMGLCSIGNMDFTKIRDYFHIGPNHVFLHAVELGLKPPVLQDPAGYVAGKAGDILSLLSHEPRGTGQLLKRNNSLRWVLLSGDWIPPVLPDKIKQVFKNAEVISLGGATEGSIWSIYYPIKEVNKEWKSIPYGYPLANQEFYVLNVEAELCPVDVPGELYIGGVGVAQAYIDDEEKTKNAFIHHPKLGRIYKTGDYGVFRKQGYIEFLGRRDSQIKIRGYRVELGEIETCLCQHEVVNQAVVIDRNDSSHKKHLCAYIVGIPGKSVPTSELRAFLAGKLPGYMIPTYFIYLEEIPLTQNGKVNRRALPEPGESADRDVEYAEPGTDIEKALVTLCREMFNLDRISIYDNFFDLGATSLDILHLRNKLKEVYKIEIPILKMFEYSTISSFSFYLSGKIPGLNENENKESAAVLKEPGPQSGETQRITAEKQAKNRFRQRIRKRSQEA
jgi:amino acid adenylation domain-containing protein